MKKSLGNVLVVDDDPDLLDLIGIRLAAAGYSVVLASSGYEAMECFKQQHPRAVITDLRMEGMDGLALFARLHEEAPTVPVIILTAHGTIPDAVAATQRGAFAFLTKPFDSRELLARVAEAVAISPAVSSTETAGAWRTRIVSSSLRMDEVLRRARRIAENDNPFLIIGPQGVGKETLARTIHQASARAKQPFVTLVCGILSPESIEAEIFGAGKTKGAPKGLLAAAAGGMLFIDELESLPPIVQVRLLPLVRKGVPGIERQEVLPDVRIVAACEGAPTRAIQEGALRADFYFSLAATTLVIPPLAERPEDIAALIASHVEAAGNNGRSFSPEALRLLLEAPWPGNTRQLISVIKQAMQLSVAAVVPASLINYLLREESEREMLCLDEARRSFERDYIVKLMQGTNGNVSQAARIAQRNRTEFYKLLGRYGIEPATYKAQGLG
ncbi:MAG: sigma 54-interacting transcriptional regulator [Zoogloeaceae bacterium]|jgi:two-component system response regulator GlrR|nr:sigma 54-interacting transcriptional regulator [Zoogloeaceae bacterium]